MAMVPEFRKRIVTSKHREWSGVGEFAAKAIIDCSYGRKPWPLVFVGDPGTGKTCAALCAADAAIHARYFTVRELVNRLTQAMKGELWTQGTHESCKLSEADVWNEVRSPEIMVLDELAKREQPSGSEVDVVHQVLELRSGRPLVAISNRNVSTVGRIYDDAIASRLAGGTVIAFGGEDQRLRKEGSRMGT